MAVRVLDRRSAADLRTIDRRVVRLEDTAAWQRVRALAARGHLSVVAERPDLSHETFGAIDSIAIRRLRQLGGDVA